MIGGPVRWLVVLNLALLVAGARPWLDADGQVIVPSWQAPEPVQPALDGHKLRLAEEQPLQPEVTALLAERPLFHPTRRPLPPKVPPPPPPPPDPLDFTTISGLLSEGNGFVLATVEGKSRRIAVGQKVGSWELREVSRQGATFSRDGQSRTLNITIAALGPPAVAANAGGAASALRPASGSAASGRSSVDAGREEQREILRRRNELRAQRGLPPVSQ